MTKGIKIVTIGGGSSYTPELIEGFIKRYDELPVRELWLVDVEEGKEKLGNPGVQVPCRFRQSSIQRTKRNHALSITPRSS